jgi:2-polyprenyl-6-methoxyphenol hydroxylase-like FAD-dependent oxidoreductase
LEVPVFHVLVIGGGIGGLCLAQALRRAGVSVTVYERDVRPDARLDRYRLHINPAGSRSLRACLEPSAWQRFLATAGRPGGGFGFLNERLATMVVDDGIMYPATTDPAERWYPVDRASLREVLLSGLGAAVHFGKAFERYETGPDGRVTAHFADGSHATGDVLVGADGVNSRVRRQYLPHAEPVDTGAVGVGMKLPLTPATRAWLPPRLAAGENIVLAPAPYFLFTSVMEGGATADGDYLLCAFVARRDALPNPAPLQETVLALTRRWHPDLRRLVVECDPDSIGAFPFMAAPRVAPWPSTNVVLLGDAIHAMPPTGGLGANTALRDARLLAQHLSAGGASAVGGYEALMRGYGSAAVRGSLATLRQGLVSNPAALAGMRAWLTLSGMVAPLRRAGFRDAWAKYARAEPWERPVTEASAGRHGAVG